MKRVPDNVTVIHHPLVLRDMSIVRNVKTDTAGFRAALARIAMILAYHSLAKLPVREIELETPIQPAKGHKLDTDVIVVPILRAGLSLVDAIINYVPEAKVGHLGMYRDENTHEPVDYYSKLPPGLESALVLVVDPMLATGGSANDAISLLKHKGAGNIRFTCLISAPEGLEMVSRNHPDVPIITASIDEKLNDDAFIVPGLGDAGDRYFGT